MKTERRKEFEREGNFFNFIEDANEQPSLQQDMRDWAEKPNLTSEALLTEFHKRGYLGVSLRDCNMIVDIVKSPQGKAGHWSY